MELQTGDGKFHVEAMDFYAAELINWLIISNNVHP